MGGESPPEATLKMVAPSEESIEAAMEWNMNVVGVSTSAFFNTEAVLLVLENLAKKKGCSPRNPLLVMGDGAKIHVSAEVYYLLLVCLC